MRPPTRVDVSQRTFFGLTYRQLAILVPAGGLALAAVAGLRDWPLFLRGALGVLVLGVGLAWAFGEMDGKTLEAWVLEQLLFRRRSRYLIHRAVRETPDGRRVAWDESEVAVAAEQEAPQAAVARRPSFLYLSANALGASILTGLTLWLAQGGALQLSRMWDSL